MRTHYSEVSRPPVYPRMGRNQAGCRWPRRNRPSAALGLLVGQISCHRSRVWFRAGDVTARCDVTLNRVPRWTDEGVLGYQVGREYPQPNGTQIPIIARAASKNSPGAPTARKKPESGKPEETVTWPNSLLYHRSRPTSIVRQASPELLCPGGRGTKPRSAPVAPEEPPRAPSTW